jgi:hypothetical protein
MNCEKSPLENPTYFGAVRPFSNSALHSAGLQHHAIGGTQDTRIDALAGAIDERQL